MIDLKKDITLVVGIDANTIEQLRISWPTWRRNRRLMFEWPWIVFYDSSHLSRGIVADLVGEMEHGIRGRQTMLIQWPPCSDGKQIAYASQREKMLSGHVFVPAYHVRTPWHMKLDTDALARTHEPWIDPEWFARNESGEYPAYIAPRWGYTKGVGFLKALDDWGDRVLPLTKRLNIPQESPDQKRVGHARMCSWCSYYRTTFTQDVVNLCCLAEPLKLPVPSQDTVAWYVAERLGLFKRIAGMKGRGWSNHARIDELRRVAAEIMKA